MDDAYLVEGDDGSWICNDCGKNVEMIPDDKCNAERNSKKQEDQGQGQKRRKKDGKY